MTNTIYALVAHSWGGMVVAALVAALGFLIVGAARWRGFPRFRFVGYLAYVLAALLAIGSVVAIVRIRNAEAGQPPMGRLVDVGGYRLHILAEGDAREGPTLVWISGGHGPGIALYHLHKVLRNETRSILFDRPGTGWSDTGTFPSSTKREAIELKVLLENAGEKGPFVLIGHSYGGLLAANYARRYPNDTAALILLDPTPPDVFTYLPGGGGPNIPKGLVRGSQITGLMKLFGLWSDPNRGLADRNDELSQLLKKINDCLADVRDAMQARSATPAGDWVAASVFSEWFDPKAVAELVVYDGELDDTPVYLVIPDDTEPSSIQQQLGISDEHLARTVNFLKRSRLRYLDISSESELIRTPAGTGHNYPYEVPEFVIDTVRGIWAKSRSAKTSQ